jgi:hypothetical protein
MAIDTYLDNITSQHRDKPKFIGWLTQNLNKIDDLYILLKGMDDDFDLDNAIGVQLDTLGDIIGRKRTLTFQPLNGFSPVLDDDTYRLVLKAKVAMNNWDGTIEQMYEIWDNIFTDIGLELQDNQDMSFNAYITGYVNEIRQDLIQHGYIVPKPETVKVNYIGKSKMLFQPYSALVASSCSTETISMNVDPAEKMDCKPYAAITVSSIQTTTINMEQPSTVIWGALKVTNPTWNDVKNKTWSDIKTYK